MPKTAPDAAKPPKPAQSKLAWAVTALLVVGFLAGVAGPIVVATAYRTVTRITESGDPKTGNYSRGMHRVNEPSPTQAAVGYALCGIGGVAALAAFVGGLVWLASAWAAVPESHGRLSPALAVALLFVPVFNLYWMFRAVPGLSAALAAALAERYPGRTFNAGRTAGLAACVMALLPGLNVLAPLALLVWFSSADRALSQLRAGRSKGVA